MKNRVLLLVSIALAVLAVCLPMPSANAHHGWSSFDENRPLYVEGTVKSVRWQNPHVELVLELKTGGVVPADLASRDLPRQSNPVDGPGIMKKAQWPSTNARTWTLELAPLFRTDAWGIEPLKPGAAIAAVGYAPSGERGATIRVEYLFVNGKAYGLRSMPSS